MKRVKLSLLGLLLVICLSSCGQSKTEEMNHVELTSESNGKESKHLMIVWIQKYPQKLPRSLGMKLRKKE